MTNLPWIQSNGLTQMQQMPSRLIYSSSTTDEQGCCLYVISVILSSSPYRLQELIYTASVIARVPGLFLAAFITLFYPVARLDGLRFVRRIMRCSPSKPQRWAVADSLLWQETSKLSHYGPGLWQPEPPGEEQQMSCVSRGTITLPPCTAAIFVCADGDWLQIAVWLCKG